MRQITYVILNEKGQMMNGLTSDYLFWTDLIVNAKLFDNQHLAENTNRFAKGTIKRLYYTLEDL